MTRLRPVPTLCAAVLTLSLSACEEHPTTLPPDGLVPAGPAFSHGTLESVTDYYDVTSLPLLPGFSRSEGRDISESGQVVGSTSEDPFTGFHAFFWSAEDGLVDVGATTGSFAIDYAINDAGAITGDRVVGTVTRAFRWELGAGLTDLSPLAGHTENGGDDINNTGMIAGRSTDGTQTRAVVWDAAGAITSLGTLGGDYSQAWGMNEAGDVVGESSNSVGTMDGFLWSASDGMAPLGLVETDVRTRPLDVNVSRELVGIRFLYEPASTILLARRAFYWSAGAGLVDLHALGGFTSDYSVAPAINDAGQVVLSVQEGPEFDEDMSAYVWSPGGEFVRLPPLVAGGAAFVSGINERSQVVGSSGTGWADRVAVVWTPLTVEEVIERAEDMIDDLVASGSLRESHSHGLLNKLAQIRHKMADGRTDSAIRQLRALINQVEAYIASGKLTEEEGERLIAAAEALIDALS